MVEYEQNRNRATTPEPSKDVFFIDRDPDLFAAILHYHDTEEYVGEELAATASYTKHIVVNPRSLLLEAQYYNLPSLEQEIRLKQSPQRQPGIKFEYCHCKLREQSSVDQLATFPLSEELVKSLTTGPWTQLDPAASVHCMKWLENKNESEVSNGGYYWALYWATLINNGDNTFALIFKGEKC